MPGDEEGAKAPHPMWQELANAKARRETERSIARAYARDRLAQMTPEEIKECALRYLTRVEWSKRFNQPS